MFINNNLRMANNMPDLTKPKKIFQVQVDWKRSIQKPPRFRGGYKHFNLVLVIVVATFRLRYYFFLNVARCGSIVAELHYRCCTA